MPTVRDWDGLRRELEGYMQKGYTDAKIKIGRNLDRPHAPLKVLGITEDTVTVEEDWQRIRAAKEIVGEGRLAVDTNASWTVPPRWKTHPVWWRPVSPGWRSPSLLRICRG